MICCIEIFFSLKQIRARLVERRYCIECFFKSFSWRYFMLNLTMFTLIIPVWRIHGRDTRSFNLEIIFWQDDNHFLFVISNLIYFMNLVWKGDVNLMLRRQVKKSSCGPHFTYTPWWYVWHNGEESLLNKLWKYLFSDEVVCWPILTFWTAIKA